MRRSALFLIFLLATSSCLTLLLGSGMGTNSEQSIAAKRQLVKQLGLTDLAIWSESRYTRHPSQADLFTAFQDYPGAFDHFPAGSIIASGRPLHSSTLRFQKK